MGYAKEHTVLLSMMLEPINKITTEKYYNIKDLAQIVFRLRRQGYNIKSKNSIYITEDNKKIKCKEYIWE